MKNMYKIATLAFLAFACQGIEQRLADPDWAQLEQWDANHNESLSLAEFSDGYVNKKFFSRWESHADQISDSTFLHHMFSFLDRNNNSVLDSAEFTSRRAAWSLPIEHPLKNWDNNKDQIIAPGEFLENAHREKIELVFDVNGDGFITEREMAEGMFTVCDKDHNNIVGGLELYHWEIYRR